MAGKREMLRDIVVVFFYIHTSNQCMIMIQCQGQAEERRKIEGYHTGKNEYIKDWEEEHWTHTNAKKMT